MSEELENEVEAINAIYGQGTLQKTNATGNYILGIPQAQSSLRMRFPSDYPESRPQIVGTERTGEHTRKGYGKEVVDLATKTLEAVFTPGLVCLFDLLQEVEASLANQSDKQDSHSSRFPEENTQLAQDVPAKLLSNLTDEPRWTLSTSTTEKKSTFLARACSVSSPVQMKAYMAHLLDNDKRVAKATHNIVAYRIRSPAATGSASEIVYQDYDDDGETSAGGRLLHLLQLMDVWGVLVVVSRWFGGVKLGPDRFSIINNVAKEAIVQGGWTRDRKSES